MFKIRTKLQKKTYTRKAYTQKFTKCKILGAEIYEVQSFFAVTPSARQFLHIMSVNFYTSCPSIFTHEAAVIQGGKERFGRSVNVH